MNHSPSSSNGSSPEPDKLLWQSADVDIAALQTIVSTRFHTQCRGFELLALGAGSYARAFLFSLENGIQVVGRVMLPVRESIKTEAEVAAIELVRARSLYCSTPKNPVRAEWIRMECMPGRTMEDCFETLTLQQKLRTAIDMANILSSLLRITAPKCGSVVGVPQGYGYLQRFRFQDPSLSSISRMYFLVDQNVDPVNIGPINDSILLDYPNQISPQLCGPFDSERQFMQAFTFMGQPPPRKGGKADYWVFEKVIEVYDAVKRLQRLPSKSRISLKEGETFHFAHCDFSDSNTLINPDTGEITGMIDWEMAGFRPPWLAAVAPGLFNDDWERFLMSEHQTSRGNYKDETPADAIVRAPFRLRLAELNEDLYRHHVQGYELRALFNACCNVTGNTEMYLSKYKDLEWSMAQRDRFRLITWHGGWSKINIGTKRLQGEVKNRALL